MLELTLEGAGLPGTIDEVGREFQAERTATAKAGRKERASFS